MFRNLTLGKTLFLAFGVVALLLLIVVAVGYTGLKTTADGITEYREMARDSNLLGQLQANMLMVRMNVKDFMITRSDKDRQEYNEYLAKMTEFLEAAKKEINAPERAEKIGQVDGYLQEYNAGFLKVQELAKQRDDQLNNVLNVKGPLLERTLTQIMESADKDQDTAAAFRAGLAMRNLLLARLYVVKFLDTNDTASVERVGTELANMQKELDVLDKELENAERRKLLEQVTAMKAEYAKSFAVLVGAIESRNKIRDETLDRLGPEVADAVEHVKGSIQEVQDTLGPQLAASSSRATVTMLSVGIGAVLAAIALALVITRGMTSRLGSVVLSLTSSADQIDSAAGQVSASSQTLASGANQQAASIEETSASMEQMAAQTKGNAQSCQSAAESVAQIADMATHNADNAKRGQELSAEAKTATERGAKAMQEISGAMGEIRHGSDRISDIIQVIEDITHQTKMLATNAAIEAARAGDQGKGFAVVADEVSKLAESSKASAKEISDLIRDSARMAHTGSELAENGTTAIKEILDRVSQVADLIGEITAGSQDQAEKIAAVKGLISDINTASEEQANGVDQVSRAVSDMDKVTQQNAANAQEAASASEELAAQAVSLRQLVDAVATIVGQGRNGEKSVAVASTEKSQGSRDHLDDWGGNGGTAKNQSTASPPSVPKNRIKGALQSIPMPGDFSDF